MKTCGECKNKNCPEEMPDPNSMACKHFKGNKITNGDLIRQMNNIELAVWGMYDLGTCPTFEKRKTCPKQGECDAADIEKCWLEWLNSEVEDE